MRAVTARTQANKLAEKVRLRIQAEQLADGSFFMTEAQVAEEYSSSRTVVREAISQLQALGILEGRKRKGLIVRHPDPVRLLSRSLPSLVGSERDLKELEMLRYVIEVGAIELAVRFATPEQINNLSETMDLFEAALQEDPGSEETDRLDLEFHSQILQMTGSRVVAGMQDVLVQFFQLAQGANEKVVPQDVGARVIWEHRELLNAIRARDVERARSMLRMQFRLESPEPLSAGSDAAEGISQN